MQDFQISTKISASFPDFNEDFQIPMQIDMIPNFRMMYPDYLLHTCRLTQCIGRNFRSSIHYISCVCDIDTMYKQVIDIYIHACRLTIDDVQGTYYIYIYNI